jgi:hypothetical protein
VHVSKRAPSEPACQQVGLADSTLPAGVGLKATFESHDFCPDTLSLDSHLIGVGYNVLLTVLL